MESAAGIWLDQPMRSFPAPRRRWLSRLLPRHLAVLAGPRSSHAGDRALIAPRAARAKEPGRR